MKENSIASQQVSKLLYLCGYNYNNYYFWTNNELIFKIKDISALEENEYPAPSLYDCYGLKIN